MPTTHYFNAIILCLIILSVSMYIFIRQSVIILPGILWSVFAPNGINEAKRNK